MPDTAPDKIIAADAPLLFFDSGVGGLTVLAAARRLLPDAPIVYAADFAGLPYGEKSEAEIAARVPVLLGRLVERYRPRLVTIACNTASTIALGPVRAALDLPVVGTVPAIKPAAALSQSRVIGVLGTNATIRQRYVDNLAAEFAGDAVVLRHGAPGLVAAAEAHLRGEPIDPAVCAAAIAGLTGQPHGDRLDTIVLACTHFPLLEAQLQAAAGPAMRFVHGADGIARRIAFLTQGQDWAPAPGQFVATGTAAAIEPYRPALKGWGFVRFETL